MNSSLVAPRERSLFVVCLLVSLAGYAGALTLGWLGVSILAGGALIALVLNGWMLGHIRGNAVRVSDRQFPDVYRLAEELAARMGLGEAPAIYVLESGGALNAFATKFLRRDFVVVYSDLLEVVYERGRDELAFVLAHEFAHVRRRHVLWGWLLTPATSIPFLGHAYSRACEYTCDHIAARHCPAGAARGLCVLAAGKRLYRLVDIEAFRGQARSEHGFWISVCELLSRHPRLPKRVERLLTLEPATASSPPLAQPSPVEAAS